MALDYTAHLDRLREALWCNREVGRASVLIGSGFSRNAKPRSPSSPPFPLWGDLGKAMARELKIRENTADPLRLASQYEAAFGRRALDSLLLRMIPDEQYEPGEAHSLLLSLPWADVFTTNYDTLLERTRPLVHTRRYDVVLSPEDLPHCARPRIVKVHGSMPSQRPFVATEEDFRRYPRDSAPFVNTVQQDAMETMLCLLGFGGDDPNFLQWVGWVRDNLGQHSPTIFLIGILDLPESERVLLASRRITPVDLGPLFPKNDWHDPQVRREKATLWLLRSLHQGRPVDMRRWPRVIARPEWPHEPGCPPLMTRPVPDIPQKPVPTEPGGRLSTEKVLELIAYCKAERLAYPGWLVCPESNRKMLDVFSWWNTRELLEVFHNLPSPQRLLGLFEIVWRLRIALHPVFDDWGALIAETLEQINPWPDRLNGLAGASVVVPESNVDPAIDWQSVEDAWVFLCFAMARYARHCFDDARFRKWQGRIAKISDLRIEWGHWAQYERCLWLLSNLEYASLREVLKEWSKLPSPPSPVWQGRRAALLAEVGDIDAARQESKSALDRTRSSQAIDSLDYTLLSIEGWLIGLQDILNKALWQNNRSTDDPVVDHSDRLMTLGLFRCDPDVDLGARHSALLKPVPAAHQVKRGFDPGVVHSSHYVSANFDSAPWALPLMFEEGCWPVRAGICDVIGKGLSIAAPRLAVDAPEYALSLMIRSRSNGIEDWLSRAQIATLEERFVASLFRLVDSGIQEGLASRDASGTLSRCIEALSRLCFRLNSTQLQHALELASELYISPDASKDVNVVGRVDDLFQRLLFSRSAEDLAWAIPRLLALPIKGSHVHPGFNRPDPFDYIDTTDTRLPCERRNAAWEESIADLLRKVKDDDAAIRVKSLTRLSVLREMGVLTGDETAKMGEALWKGMDRNSLPEYCFTIPYLLTLPEPVPGLASEHVRAYFLERPFPSMRGTDSGISTADLSNVHSFMTSLYDCTRWPWHRPDIKRTRIDWSPVEARTLLANARVWWSDTKPILSKLLKEADDDDFARWAKVLVRWFIRVIGDVIAMRLPDSSIEDVQAAFKLVEDVRVLEKNALVHSPHGLLRLGVSMEDVSKATEAALFEFAYEQAVVAANGVLGWQLWARAGIVPAPPMEIVNKFIMCSVVHRDSTIGVWLGAVGQLVRVAPETITDNHLRTLTLGLARLLEDSRLDAPSGSASAIPLHDRPEVRSAAAGLASALHDWCTSYKMMDPPATLKAWREACAADPLPEVRRAWKL